MCFMKRFRADRVELPGLDLKFYDTGLASTAVSNPTDATGGEFDPSATSMISTPAQGDGEQNRDGKKILIKSVQISGAVIQATSSAGTATSAESEVFVALVLDSQTNGVQLSSEDVFKNTAATSVMAPNVMRNLLFAPRFKVLKQWKLRLEPKTSVNNASATTVSIGGSRVDFDCYLPLDLVVNFNSGTTASVANVIDNSLHIIAYVSQVALTPTIQYNARIRFLG